MKRAVVSPILSGLVIPGLGQIVNRQVAKGAFMVAGVSLLFMVTLGLTMHKISQAVIALDGQQLDDKWAAFRQELMAQGTGWLWVLGAVLVALWVYGIVDAYAGGRAFDRRQEK